MGWARWLGRAVPLLQRHGSLADRLDDAPVVYDDGLHPLLVPAGVFILLALGPQSLLPWVLFVIRRLTRVVALIGQSA